LTSLLHYGNAAEISASGSAVSPLFAGGNDWIASVTTISTPHDGTTLSTFLVQNIPFFENFVVGLFTLASITPGEAALFDFRLTQWGISPQQSGESFSHYANRVFGSSLFNNLSPGTIADLSPWDLSPDGAHMINTNFPLSPNVYYYSYATRTTYSTYLCFLSYAETATFTTMPLLGSGFLPLNPLATTTWMGSCEQSESICYYQCNDNTISSDHLPSIDSSWFPNDGVVNTRAMNGPSFGLSSPQYKTYTGTNAKGIFQVMTPFQTGYSTQYGSYDHLAICGANPGLVPSVVPFYNSIAKFLSNLPL